MKDGIKERHPTALSEEAINAQRLAASALQRCLTGDSVGGLAIYRDPTLINADMIGVLPLGLHISLIEQTGETAAAEALRALAVRAGFDVTALALREHASPPSLAATSTAARTYEALFISGHVNPVMIDRYLRALTALGRVTEVAALFDVSRLLHCTTLGDADAVAAALLAKETRLPYSNRVQISYAMRSLDDLQSA